VNQVAREKIASGQDAKFPMASVDGKYQERGATDLEGVEFRFNPKRVHLFTDAQNLPVRWAEQVTVYGNRVYARGRIEFYTSRTAPARTGSAASAVVF
jgi:hypothetical protein